MATQSHSTQFAGGSLGSQRHICAFFNSRDEEHRVLGSFIKEGFEKGDKAFHLVNPDQREDHLKRLAAAAALTRTPGWFPSRKCSSPAQPPGTRRQDSWLTWSGRSSTYPALEI